jgi:hypothetical protein
MKLLVINECIRDARGSRVRNVGHLIAREQAILAYERALKAMDGLAVRQAVRDLFQAMGWTWSHFMAHATKDWPRHPSQAPRLPVTATEPEGSLPFTVVAGKFYNDGERSYSYIESFGTLAEAEAALDKVRSYPFAEIESSENGSCSRG